jgi:hypothetical protein
LKSREIKIRERTTNSKRFVELLSEAVVAPSVFFLSDGEVTHILRKEED